MAERPNDVSELQYFIGSANYLQKLIPHFADKMAPLYALLKLDSEWKWESTEQSAFDQIREAMSSDTTLGYHSCTRDVVLQVNASGKGLGAVMLQPDGNGQVRPIAYASRVLTVLVHNNHFQDPTTH